MLSVLYSSVEPTRPLLNIACYSGCSRTATNAYCGPCGPISLTSVSSLSFLLFPTSFLASQVEFLLTLLLAFAHGNLNAATEDPRRSLPPAPQLSEERITTSTVLTTNEPLPAYKVSGILTNTALAGDFVSRFTVRVDSCQWQIEILPIAFPPEYDRIGGVRPDSITAGSDGVEFYCTKSFATKARPGSNVGQAQRGPGSAPFGVQEEVLAIWYTYASGCYLKVIRTNLLVPLEFHTPGRIATAGGVPGEFQLEAVPPYLPRKVQTHGYLTSYSANQQSLRRHHFTNSTLEVLSKTNYEGMSFPSRTSIEHNQISELRGALIVQKRGRTELLLESLMLTGAAPQKLPAIAGKTAITDFRHMPSNPAALLSLMATNWPNDTQIARAAASKRIRGGAKRDNLANAGHLWPLVLLVTVVLMPLILWLRLHTKQRKRGPTIYEKNT